MSIFLITKWGRVYQHGLVGVYENRKAALAGWEEFKKLHEHKLKTESNQLDGYHIYVLVSGLEPRLEEYYTNYSFYEVLNYDFQKSPLNEDYPYSIYLKDHTK